jgi:serine/threonine-protein kinase HipA
MIDVLRYYGGSSGGARPKIHYFDGSDYWIIKFPFSGDPKAIGRYEYEANHLAQECGIATADCRLFPSKLTEGYFGSKRFDHRGSGTDSHDFFSGAFGANHPHPQFGLRSPLSSPQTY